MAAVDVLNSAGEKVSETQLLMKYSAYRLRQVFFMM